MAPVGDDVHASIYSIRFNRVKTRTEFVRPVQTAAPTTDTEATGMLKFPTTTANNDALLFNNNTSAANKLYRDPTPLFQVSPNIPAGSGLTVDTTDGTLKTAPGYAGGRESRNR